VISKTFIEKKKEKKRGSVTARGGGNNSKSNGVNGAPRQKSTGRGGSQLRNAVLPSITKY